MKQKVIEAKHRLASRTGYCMTRQTKEKPKWNQMNQMKENKKSFETSFKPTWHKIKILEQR